MHGDPSVTGMKIKECPVDLESENLALNEENARLKGIIDDCRRIKNALRLSEENLKGFLASLPHSAHLIDREGTVLISSEVSPARLGISLDEYIGTNIFAHLPHGLAAERREHFERILRSRETVSWEDAREGRHYAHYGSPVLDDEGNVDRIAHIALDITDRKMTEDAIRESEEKYRAVVEMSPDAIVIHQDGRIVYANPASARLFHLPASDVLIGTDAFARIHPGFLAIARENTRNDLEGRDTPPTEIQVTLRDGTLATFEGRGRKLIFQGRPAIQVVLRDISERKKADEQLQEFSRNLARTNEELELFISIASHDLQEPIRNIVTSTQRMLRESRGGDAGSFEKNLKTIEKAGLRMHALINSLREYSAVRKRDLQSVSMENAFSSALENLRQLIKETGATVTNDPLPDALADPTQIIQVFQNLIENAIKFRKEGVPPVIRVSASRDGDVWEFSVTDNGIGIPSDYYDRIFVLFEQLHQRDIYPGTGLGLALCKKIIERHRGRMWVSSVIGEGSTFFFTLKAE